mgnify:FL=1
MGYQSRATLVQVQGIAGVRAAAGGWDFTVIFKEDGTDCSVGANNYGQLRDGTHLDPTFRTPLPWP